MNQNETQTQRPFMSRIRAALESVFMNRIHPVHEPYNPQPGQHIHNPASDVDGNYSETEADIQPLHGTSIAFGTQKTIQVDGHGRPRGLCQNPSYILGSGRRVSSMEDVGGICRFCQIQAAQAFQEGTLTVEQAQLRSLFDIYSGFQCDICGVYTCSVHCRPMHLPEGILDVCSACREEIKRQEKRRKIISMFLSPFTKSENSECR